MTLLNISIILFLILESLNVAILYFAPDSRRGNGVAVFNFWERSKADQEASLFTRYFVNWVAGTKIIFILLFMVILIFGSDIVKLWSVGVAVLGISTYYWRLHPIIKQMDAAGWITPSGYAKTLGRTIAVFICVFSMALLYTILKEFI